MPLSAKKKEQSNVGCSFSLWSECAYATRGSKCSDDSCCYGCNHLYDELQCFFSAHSFLKFKGLKTWGRGAPDCLITAARHITAAAAWALLLVVGVVLGQLGHVACLGQLAAGELAGGTGAHVDALDVLGGREILAAGGTALGRLDACAEDGQIRQLDGLALQHQLADAVHHISEHASDGTLGVRRVVLRHVLGQCVEVDGLADGYGACEPLAIDFRVFVLVF